MARGDHYQVDDSIAVKHSTDHILRAVHEPLQAVQTALTGGAKQLPVRLRELIATREATRLLVGLARRVPDVELVMRPVYNVWAAAGKTQELIDLVLHLVPPCDAGCAAGDNAQFEALLFRNADAITALLNVVFYQDDGKAFLASSLSKMLKKLQKLSEPPEMDPNRLPFGMAAEQVEAVQAKHAEVLMDAVDMAVKAIASRPGEVPPTIRYVLNAVAVRLARSVKGRLTPSGCRQAVVRGLFFLRFVSPAVVSPQRYGVMPASFVPSMELQRSLVLVGKVLQAAANNVVWDGSKESFLQPCNDFVREMSKRLEAFGEELIPRTDEVSSELGLKQPSSAKPSTRVAFAQKVKSRSKKLLLGASDADSSIGQSAVRAFETIRGEQLVAEEMARFPNFVDALSMAGASSTQTELAGKVLRQVQQYSRRSEKSGSVHVLSCQLKQSAASPLQLEELLAELLDFLPAKMQTLVRNAFNESSSDPSHSLEEEEDDKTRTMRAMLFCDLLDSAASGDAMRIAVLCQDCLRVAESFVFLVNSACHNNRYANMKSDSFAEEILFSDGESVESLSEFLSQDSSGSSPARQGRHAVMDANETVTSLGELQSSPDQLWAAALLVPQLAGLAQMVTMLLRRIAAAVKGLKAFDEKHTAEFAGQVLSGYAQCLHNCRVDWRSSLKSNRDLVLKLTYFVLRYAELALTGLKAK